MMQSTLQHLEPFRHESQVWQTDRWTAKWIEILW